MSRARCPWDSRKIARRAKQAHTEASAREAAVMALWPAGHVTIEAPGFEAHELYGGDLARPLRVWIVEHAEPGERRPWTYELLADIREAAGRPPRLPGL